MAAMETQVLILSVNRYGMGGSAEKFPRVPLTVSQPDLEGLFLGVFITIQSLASVKIINKCLSPANCSMQVDSLFMQRSTEVSGALHRCRTLCGTTCRTQGQTYTLVTIVGVISAAENTCSQGNGLTSLIKPPKSHQISIGFTMAPCPHSEEFRCLDLPPQLCSEAPSPLGLFPPRLC